MSSKTSLPFELLESHSGIVLLEGTNAQALKPHLTQVTATGIAKSIPTRTLCDLIKDDILNTEINTRKNDGDVEATNFLSGTVPPPPGKKQRSLNAALAAAKTSPAGGTVTASTAGTPLVRSELKLTANPSVISSRRKLGNDSGQHNVAINQLTGSYESKREELKVAMPGDINGQAMALVNHIKTEAIAKTQSMRNKHKFTAVVEALHNYIEFHYKEFGGFTTVEQGKVQHIVDELICMMGAENATAVKPKLRLSTI